jgi:hypothetical protein
MIACLEPPPFQGNKLLDDALLLNNAIMMPINTFKVNIEVITISYKNTIDTLLKNQQR